MGTKFKYNGDFNSASGTAQLYVYDLITGGIGSLAVGMIGLSLPLRDLSQAMSTASNTDDLFLLRKAFAKNDTLDGSEFDDDLRGFDGNDTILGNLGNDDIVGGLGKDIISGGFGADWFHYLTAKESIAGSKTRDIIRDFNSVDGDKINLQSLDANTKLEGQQKAIFIGSDPFSGGQGEARFSQGVIQIDTNLDRKPDMEIQLDGVVTFQLADLLL